MRHEDVVKKIMLAQLARTLTEWRCNSSADLIDEMEQWDWNVANKDFWSRVVNVQSFVGMPGPLVAEKQEVSARSPACVNTRNQ